MRSRSHGPGRTGLDKQAILDALGFLATLVALALVWIEQSLAQPNRLRRYFDQLIVLNISKRFLQGHANRRREADGLVLGMGADVGQLFAFEDVDLKVIVAGVLADDHAAIDLPAR